MTKETKTLIQAIAEFQKAAPIILKSATNPFFKSKYADLPAVWHTIKDLMASNGLAVVNMNVIVDGLEYLETRIYHTSGEYISSVSRLSPVKSDPQSVGSAITYMRRYALMSLLGLVADDDDDANAASGKDVKPATKQAEQVKTLTSDELTLILTSIVQSKNAIDLESAKLKANAAKPRMTKEQAEEIRMAILKQSSEFIAKEAQAKK